jgi:hypothetical protein
VSVAHGTSALFMENLVTASDPDGDPVAQYRLYDGTPGSNGYFVENGTPRLANQNFIVSDLSTVDFITSAAGADTIWVQAYDGYGWGAWSKFTIQAMPNATAVLAPLDAVYTPTRGTASIDIESRFAFNDPDASDTPARYRFYDGTPGAGGNFVINGTPWLANQNFIVEAADLATVDFAPASSGSDVIWLQVDDGYGWGAWTKFTVNAPQNSLPTVTTFSQSAQANTVLGANTLFSVPGTDADGDAVVKYGFWDSTTGGGSFRVSGVGQSAASAVEVMAGQLATLDFMTSNSAGTDRLWVRAHDGFGWSDWQALNITTLVPS